MSWGTWGQMSRLGLTHSRGQPDRPNSQSDTAHSHPIFNIRNRGEGNSHVRKQPHAKRRQRRNGRRGRDEITPNLLHAHEVLRVRVADGVLIAAIAHARAARLGHDGRIHGDDVRHGEEDGEAGADLGEEVRPLALSGLHNAAC